MSAAKLREALKDCAINFDRRVLVTDLLEEYELSYEVVNKTLEEYLSAQEKKGGKYEKRYLVQGEDESHNEIYTIVKGEAKLQEWLQKLQDAESSLYSVEVAGGAKAPARELKPVSRYAIQLKNVGVRAAALQFAESGSIKPNTNKQESTATKVKQENALHAAMAKRKEDHKSLETSKHSKATNKTATPKKESPEIKKSSADTKKSSPEAKKTTPEEKKTQKKGINNFFAPSSSKDTKTTEISSKASGVIKPPTPKKMQDFFKKQVDKPKATEIKKEVNTSVQLFEEEDAATEETVVVESDDEEQQLAAIKRQIADSDHEDEEPTTSSKSKRRRIVDSDDEEDEPQQKIEKKEEKEQQQECETDVKSETYLDDEGFVITIRSKKRNVSKPAPSRKEAKTPTKVETPSKPAPAAATKTKQANIMNFFAKK